jgi:hypothetical protein
VSERAEGPPSEGSSQAAGPRISGQHHPAATETLVTGDVPP